MSQCITECADTITPAKPAKSKGPARRASWFTVELKSTRCNCRQLERKWCTSNKAEDHTTFKTALNQYHRLLKETKKNALADYLEASANRSKELFAIVKEFSNPAAANNEITPSQELCDNLVDFFQDKISVIYENI